MTAQLHFLRVILTLSYSQVFGKALTIADLYRRQIALASYDVISVNQITQVIQYLVKQGLVQLSADGIVPTAAWHPTLTERVMSRLRQTKLVEAQAVAGLLTRLPWIQAVALTGSIAAGSAKLNDDCDFFIITTPHGLWLTRLLVLLIAKVKGKRRSFAKEEPNSWCFNMWLSENHLILPVNMRSLYTAYELCQSVWLVNKNQTAQRFIAANGWARRLLPVYFKQAYQQAASLQLNLSPGEKVIKTLSVIGGGMINWLGFIFQYLYMLPHKTSEWVGYSHAFFHPRPTGQLTLAQLQKWLEYYLYSITEETTNEKPKTVLVTGVFDLLHAKHRQLLAAAAQLGQVWVGVESDSRVRRLKGWHRPFEPAWRRVLKLNQRSDVHRAFILPEQMQLPAVQRQLLSKIQPDILAVSASTPNLAKKRQLMAEIGGRVEVVLTHDRTISTTRIAQGKSQYK